MSQLLVPAANHSFGPSSLSWSTQVLECKMLFIDVHGFPIVISQDKPPGEAMRAAHTAERMKWPAGRACVFSFLLNKMLHLKLFLNLFHGGGGESTVLMNKDPTLSADYIEAFWEEIYCLLSGLIYEHLRHLDPISLCSPLHWSLRSHIVTCIKWKLGSCFPRGKCII